MNMLNNTDLNNRPVLKYTIIVLIVVNAVVLALLLFGPGRLFSTAPDGGNASAGSTVRVSEREDDDEEEQDSDNSDEGDTDEAAEDEMPESGPILELVDDHVTLKVGDYFNFYDYIKTMEDRDGSDLSHYIHLVGQVNTYTPGDYTITYQITSQIDGKTASKDLKVTVEY